MKIIKYLFYLILILSNKEVLLGGDYSIDIFLDYLQEKGYYDLIQAIKGTFGDDIAKDICKQLTKSNDCEIVVRVYMIETSVNQESGPKKFPRRIDTELYEQIFGYFENKYSLTEEMKILIKIILDYYYDLKENMAQDEIIDLIDRSILEWQTLNLNE